MHFLSFGSRLLRMLHQVSGRSPLRLSGGHHPLLLRGGFVLWLWTCGSCRHCGDSWATLLHQHQGPCCAEWGVSTCFPLKMCLKVQQPHDVFRKTSVLSWQKADAFHESSLYADRKKSICIQSEKEKRTNQEGSGIWDLTWEWQAVHTEHSSHCSLEHGGHGRVMLWICTPVIMVPK